MGKTTLINRLDELGYATVPEAAMQVIDVLNGLIGPEQQLAWRTAHKAAFGALLGAIAVAQEARAASSEASVVFLDRSILDNLGYARVRGYDPPNFLTASVISSVVARIRQVFVLDVLASNQAELEVRNAETGRATDPQGSRHVSSVMHDVYASLGCRTEWLPDLPVEQRLQRLLQESGAPRPGQQLGRPSRSRVRALLGSDKGLPVVCPVIHCRDASQAVQQVTIAQAAGCTAVSLISHEGRPAEEMLPIIRAVRRAHPSLKLGVNFHCEAGDVAFPLLARLATEHGCHIDFCWCDNAWVDCTKEEQPRAQSVAVAYTASGWRGLYMGGVAFKNKSPPE